MNSYKVTLVQERFFYVEADSESQAYHKARKMFYDDLHSGIIYTTIDNVKVEYLKNSQKQDENTKYAFLHIDYIFLIWSSLFYDEKLTKRFLQRQAP